MKRYEKDKKRFWKKFEEDHWILNLGDHRLDEPLFKENDIDSERIIEDGNNDSII